MKKSTKKALSFRPETVRVINESELREASGGAVQKSNPQFNTCGITCPSYMPMPQWH